MITQENIRKFEYECPQKCFFGRSQVLEFFSTTGNDRIFLFSRVLEKTYISMNLCILVDYTRKTPKIWVWMSSKKVFSVGLRFSNFFRLLETTEFCFSLEFLKRLISALTCVFWLITQENTRKFKYEWPQKKFFGSVSCSRIFFDYLKRPNFFFF